MRAAHKPRRATIAMSAATTGAVRHTPRRPVPAGQPEASARSGAGRSTTGAPGGADLSHLRRIIDGWPAASTMQWSTRGSGP